MPTLSIQPEACKHMSIPITAKQRAEGPDERDSDVSAGRAKKPRRRRQSHADRTPDHMPPVEVRPPMEPGGLAEFIEALAHIIADVCVDAAQSAVLPSDPPANSDQKKAA